MPTEGIRLIIKDCIALAQSCPELFYLQAMCYLCEGDPSAALSEFKSGWQKDQAKFRYSDAWLYFDLAFKDHSRSTSRKAGRLAEAALYAMFGVELGQSGYLIKTVIETPGYIIASTLKELPDDTTEQFIYELLDIRFNDVENS